MKRADVENPNSLRSDSGFSTSKSKSHLQDISITLLMPSNTVCCCDGWIYQGSGEVSENKREVTNEQPFQAAYIFCWTHLKLKYEKSVKHDIIRVCLREVKHMDKPLAIGIDNFREIREDGYYYIDKTLMIEDFIRHKEKVALISRPRRFGKTLNMTMMREFFDISKDSKNIFEGLKIMDTDCARRINSVPVIFLTFKNCAGNILEELQASFAKAIQSS